MLETVNHEKYGEIVRCCDKMHLKVSSSINTMFFNTELSLDCAACKFQTHINIDGRTIKPESPDAASEVTRKQVGELIELWNDLLTSRNAANEISSSIHGALQDFNNHADFAKVEKHPQTCCDPGFLRASKRKRWW